MIITKRTQSEKTMIDLIRHSLGLSSHRDASELPTSGKTFATAGTNRLEVSGIERFSAMQNHGRDG